MSKTKIEWADKVWNPITGCTKISEGCQNCYAERMSKRLAGRCGYPKENPFAVTFHQDKLQEPMKWKKPSRIFVCSMGDLFHEQVPQDWLYPVFFMMALCPQHTFMVLTKRPENMKKYIDHMMTIPVLNGRKVPLSNVWLGVTAENQEQADKRIPVLLDTPAAKRFVSVEPMLGSVDIRRYLYDRSTVLDWVICGGETGPKARPIHPDWPRALRDQCQYAEVPFFFKKEGNSKIETLDGKEWRQVP